MKNRLFALFLPLILVVLSAGGVLACGDDSCETAASPASRAADHCGAMPDACVETHPGRDCPPDDDGCGQCHCPGCGATAMACAGFLRQASAEWPGIAGFNTRRADNFHYQAPRGAACLSALFRPPIA